MHSTTRGHRWTRRARPRRRQPFPSWSLDLPSTLAEAFVADGSGYWHAWEANRSVSLTSMLLTDGGRPVTAAEIAAILPPLTGELIDEFPPHLIGRAAYGEAVQPARASHAMSGMLVATGAALCVTITTDDFDWARQVWLSIRHHPIPPRADEPRH